MQGELTDKLLDQMKRARKREEDLENLNNSAETDPFKIEQNRFEREKRQHAGNAAAIEALTKIHERNLVKIRLDAMDAKMTSDKELYEASKKALTAQQQQELLSFKGTTEAKTALRQEHLKEQQELEEKHLTDLATLLKTFVDAGLFDSVKFDIELLTPEEKKELEKQIEIINKLIGATKPKPKPEDEKPKDEPEYSFENGGVDILGMTQDDWELFFKNLKDGEIGIEEIAFALKALTGAYAMYDKFATNAENKQLEEFKKVNQKKRLDLDQRLDSGLISQESYNAQVSQMDAEYSAMEDEMRIKQAKRDKAMAISDAIINTALGITSAIGAPFPLNIALPVLVGALGAAQIALIASTPIETAGAEQGGLVAERMQDGRRFNAKSDPKKRGFVKEPTILVSEKGQEYVIPADGMKNPTLSPFIGAIEQARKSGSLSNFNFEAVYRQPTIVPGYAKGGSVGGSTPRVATAPPAGGVLQLDPNTNGMLTEILKEVRILNKNSQNPIPAVVSILGKGGLEQAMERHNRLKKRGELG